ncbi:BatA domain-containing protein [Parafilimonas sp.]|uniref:BatA domain-containing protein n=1 Tax=Parafilimonas sp. TaxID=1969739 RepID=UPI0039E24463
MSFLQPIWLYAISGIIIPVAIHFWNIKEGKALPVGSIVLLEKSTKKYTKTLRIHEWLLLALRCLLIVFSAMLLAKPVRQQKFNDKQGWILMDRQSPHIVYDHFKPVIDSLIHKGYEIHRFNDGFEKINLEDALSAEDTGHATIQYWPLIKKADNQLPASFPVYVFTTNRLKNFNGERPQVNAGVKWLAYTPDTSAKQLAKAWKTDDSHIRVMLVNSAASGNMFSYDDVPANQGVSGDYTIASANGRLSIACKKQPPVMVDTAVLYVSIYAGENALDAGYIKASLDAIAQFTKQRIQTTVCSNISSVPQKNEWLFWLSDGSLPKSVSAAHVFKYEYGKEITASSIMQFYNISAQQSINIDKRIAADSSMHTSSVLWEDGFGNPLLTVENAGGITAYRFYSRFSPQWNGLAWSEAFPSIILHLMYNDAISHINNNYADERIIDAKQIQPVLINNPGRKTVSVAESLSTLFWLTIFLLFCAERIISFKTKAAVQ